MPKSPFLVEPGTRINLSKIDPDDTGSLRDKDTAKAHLKIVRKRIEDLQERLYAEHRQSLLVVLQATDTGGKDGTIKHVFKGINPQGCRVTSFREPSAAELDHDFLWRIHPHAPAKGMIGVFNRSHYEDVLVVRVKDLVPKPVWSQRYESINEFEKRLAENGTRILKFYLHISKDEQKERLQARLDDPSKHWKFNVGDLADRERWDDYQQAFEDAIGKCSTDYAPWFVIPANHKWARNVFVAEIIADTLEDMNPQFPEQHDDLTNIIIPG
jgi:PPK2 family polyphosphate:nucleotide phosphotransferase